MVNRKIAPVIKQPVEFNITLPSCEKFVLDNGVELYYINAGAEDTLMVNWVFSAGNWFEKKRNVAIAANHLIKNGTSKYSAFDINNHFDYYGSYFNRNCYSETAELVLHCLGKHVKELLPMVASLIEDAIYPEEELQIYQQNAQQKLKVNLLKPDFVAGREIDAMLFGDQHPYGKYSRLEDYQALKREDIVAFHKEYYKEGSAILFAVGKLPDGFLPLMNELFGKFNWKKYSAKIESPQHIIQPSKEKNRSITLDENGVQASIRIARNYPGKVEPNYHEMVMLNTIYGGYFGSRLMANIREEKGYTYGIYSGILNYTQHSGMVISTEAGIEVKDATIQEVYKEMDILREELIEEEELLNCKNYMMGVILGDLDGPFQVIARWKSLILQGLDQSFFDKGIRTVKEVQATELRNLAQQYLNPNEFYELVVI